MDQYINNCSPRTRSTMMFDMANSDSRIKAILENNLSYQMGIKMNNEQKT